MPTYRYKAVAPNGELMEGEMEGTERGDIIRALQALGRVPIQAELLRAPTRLAAPRAGTRLNLPAFTQEMASLLGAGVPLDRALGIMRETRGRAAPWLSEIHDAVRGGAALSATLEGQPHRFSPFYVNMVRTGETAGVLDRVLARLAEQLECRKRMREQLLTALTYPAILLVVSIASLTLVLTLVVPRFEPLFADLGDALPLSTQLVLSASNTLLTYGWIAPLPLIGLAALLLRWRLGSTGRQRIDELLLRLPIVGELIRTVEAARFGQSLGLLLESGIPLPRALPIARGTLFNRAVRVAVEQASERLKAGGTLGATLTQTGVFPVLALQLIRIGEETGRLDTLLQRSAELLERETAATVRRMLTILEPALIVGLGMLIAGIILSLMAAIVSVNDVPI